MNHYVIFGIGLFVGLFLGILLFGILNASFECNRINAGQYLGTEESFKD